MVPIVEWKVSIVEDRLRADVADGVVITLTAITSDLAGRRWRTFAKLGSRISKQSVLTGWRFHSLASVHSGWHVGRVSDSARQMTFLTLNLKLLISHK